MSYASKRERANIAFNIKVKMDTAKNKIHIVRAPSGARLWPRNVFFAAQHSKFLKQSKLEKPLLNKTNLEKQIQIAKSTYKHYWVNTFFENRIVYNEFI